MRNSTPSDAPRAEQSADATDPTDSSRRRFLAAAGASTTALLAGCTGMLSGGSKEPMNNSTAPPASDTPTDEAEDTGTPTGTGTPRPVETDVGGVQYSSEGTTYTFRVTLDHEGEEGGPDWWQLETLGGEQLARKSFDSPRPGERFTTEKQVDLPDTKAVVVRGHDAKAGYGGRVMLADLENNDLALEDQGPEKKSFDGYSF